MFRSNPDDVLNPSSLLCPVEMEPRSGVKCGDGDLLSVSSKLVHLSLDMVGKCLGLEESQVQDALKQVTEYHQHVYKIYLLLMKWKEMNRDTATWGALIQCMESLPNLEIADMKGKLLCNVQSSFQKSAYLGGHMEKQEMEMKWKLETETRNGKWKWKWEQKHH